MSLAVICDECGKILKDTDALHCHDAVVSTNSRSNFVYGADICKDCQSKFNMKSSILWCSAFFMVQLSHLGSKITADGDCSHEIKRRLLLGRKVMTKLDSILKIRDVTLPTNVY